MWVIAPLVLLLITAIITQHVVIRKLEKQLDSVNRKTMRNRDFSYSKITTENSNNHKKSYEEKIKKATQKLKEVEYIEFKGCENFKEVLIFVENHFTNLTLNVDRLGDETIKTDSETFKVGTIFYRYLDPYSNDYECAAMSKDRFFRFYA